MKKNILKRALFALVVMVVCGLSSVDADTLPVVVAGTRLTDETNTMSLGEGTLTYNKENKELILDNVTITSDSNFGISLINTVDEIKIILKGNNKIITTGNNFGIRSEKNIVITGDGKLTITSEFPTIQGRNITIDGAELDLTTTGEYLAAIENNYLLIIKNNSKMKIKGYGSAISSFGRMEIADSELELEATGDTSNAIYVEPTNDDGSLIINNSKIKAKSGYACVYSAGEMKISKSSFNLESIAGGIYSDASVNIKDSKVYVTDGNYGVGVGQGAITVDNSTFKISVNGKAFINKPNIEGLDNKVIYVGHEKDGSDAEELDLNSDFDFSEYKYVRVASKYTISIIADDNVVLDNSKEISVIEGESKELIIKAKEGYKIKSILVNNEEVTLNDNKLSLTNIDKDMIIKITSEEISKALVEIDNPKTSDNIIIYMVIGLLSIIEIIFIKKSILVKE